MNIFFSCYNSTKVKAQEQMFGLINAEGKFAETKQDYMTTALHFSTHPGQRADQHGSALLCLHASMPETASPQGSDVWLSYTNEL